MLPAGEILDSILHEFDLPLRHTFTISRASTTVQPTLIVELQADGHHGYGEATTNSYYGVTVDANGRSGLAVAVADRYLGESARSRGPLLSELAAALPDESFAQCALDQAAHDLWGKLQAGPVLRLWGLDDRDDAPVRITRSASTRSNVMVAKLQEIPDWPVYKIKLGTTDDLEIVRELREHTDATFRVDANCGWTADETIAQLARH